MSIMAQQPDDYLPSPTSANLKPPQFARFRLANLDPTAQEEQNEAIRHVIGMVIGQGDDACAQADPPCALSGGCDEDLGRADDLGSPGMMLTDPDLVEAQLLDVLDEL